MDDPRPPETAAAAAPLPPPTAASAEEALKPPAPPAEPQVSPGKGVKETIESILIAFVLAFVFRAFVVEAFVIPTGSMATTLLGAHLRFTCKECGFRFDANYPNASSGDDIRINTEPLGETKYEVYCENCRHRTTTTPDQTVRYGDRILVLKYLYIPWVSNPQRWDVVVFKSPTSNPGAKDPPYTVNYIKRLVGLPNEQVMILYGDLYTRKTDTEQWQIQPKPKYAQDALWRIIYDHDYRPLEKDRKDGWVLPWRSDGGTGWDTGDAQKSRVITFDNLAGQGRLRFMGDKVPQAPDQHFRSPSYFTDWLSYDVVLSPGAGLGGYQTYPVNDLRLCFSYERKAGDGALRARLTKLKREFVLEMLPDRIRLLHAPPGKGDPEEVGAVKPLDPSTMSGPLRVEFANVDCEVTVRVNEHLVFRKQYDPSVDDLLARAHRDDRLPSPGVSIDAENQQAVLSHVSLWRDVYYTPAGSHEWTQRRDDRPMHSIKLGDDEYFVLGDNSAASSDARHWTETVDLTRDEDLYAEPGRVPGRFMLGRAFFVYWPAGHRPFSRAPAIIPDFGSMRLIH